MEINDTLQKQLKDISARAMAGMKDTFAGVDKAVREAVQSPVENTAQAMKDTFQESYESIAKGVTAPMDAVKREMEQTQEEIQRIAERAAKRVNLADTIAPLPETAPRANSKTASAVFKDKGIPDFAPKMPNIADVFQPAASGVELLRQKLQNVEMQMENEKQKLAGLNAEFAKVSLGTKAWDELSAKITASESRLISMQQTLNATQSKLNGNAKKTAEAAQRAAAQQSNGWKTVTKEQQAASVRGMKAVLSHHSGITGSLLQSARAQSAATKQIFKEQTNAFLSAATSQAKGVGQIGVIGRAAAASLKGLATAIPVAGFFAAFKVLQHGFSLASQNSAAFQSSLNSLKANLAVAFTPIYQAVLPALNSLMSALATAASYLASFLSMLFGKTYKQSLDATKKMQGLQASVGKGSGGSGNGSGGGGGNGSAPAEKEDGTLASFDLINTLPGEDTGAGGGSGGSTGDGGAGGGAMGGLDFGAIEGEGNAVAEKVKGFFDALRAAFAPTTEALKGLWAEFQRFGSFAWDGLKDFYNSFLVPVGNWVLGEGLPGLINSLTDGMSKINWGNINAGLHELWTVLAPFAVHVGEGLLWLWDNVLVPLGTWVVNDVVPVFLQLLTNAIDSLNQTIDILKPAGQWLWENFLLPIAEWTGGVIVDVLKGIADNMDLIGPALAGIATGLILFNIADAIIKFTQWAKSIDLVKVAVFLMNAVLNVNPIMLICTAIGAAVAAFLYFWNTNEDFRNFFINLWEGIKSAFGTIIDGIANFFTKTLPDAWNHVSKFFAGIPDWWNGLWSKVGQFFTDCWNGVISFFTDTIPQWIEKVKEFFDKLPYYIGLAIGDMLGHIVKFGADTWNWVTTELPKIIQGIGDWFSKLPGNIWNWLCKVVANIGKWGQDTWNSASQWVQKTINGIGEWFQKLPSNIWKWLCDTVTNVVKWGGDMLTQGKKAATDLFNAIVNTVKELPNKMLDIGRNIVEGIWNGIKNAGEWIKDQISGFCGGLVDGFKKSLGIYSPSRVFAKQIGQFIPQGIWSGIDGWMPQLEQNLSNSVSKMVSGVQGSFSDVPIALGCTIEQPELATHPRDAQEEYSAARISVSEKEPDSMENAVYRAVKRILKELPPRNTTVVAQLDSKVIARETVKEVDRLNRRYSPVG